MKYLYIFLALSICVSCIPVKIAPNMKEGKIVPAKKFVRELGNQYVYVFEDPKKANEFYNYVNAKYHISYDEVNGNVPVTIAGRKSYLTFYEVDKQTKTINLVPMLLDATLEDKGYSPAFEDAHVSRVGTWYVALTVTDEALKDCLHPNYSNLLKVEAYLRSIQEEYLSTVNYMEVYLKNQKQ